MNGNSFPQQQRVHPTHPHTRTESMSTVASHKPQHAQQPQQRVVRKEPQVKPINRYAPPDYMTIMYHPTPTLEDLGLTSYLDSPPSSPRARSPAREAEMADSPPAQESPRRVLPAWDAPRSVSPAQESSSDSSEREFKTAISQAIEIETAISADKQSPETVSEAKKSTLNVTNQMSESHQTISNTQMSQHLTTKVEPQRYVPSFAPKGWDPHAKSSKSIHGPASTESVINATSRPATFTVPISKSANGLDVQSTNSTGPGSGSTLAEKPEKWACNWSLIAEQYSTESRHSVNEKQRCDALYRRYNTDERQQTHTTKHHQNHDAWHQEHTNVQHSKQTFDQILAEQIARQAELKSNNHNLALQTCTNVSEKRSKCQSISKTSLPIVNMDDLFGGMSPYSCWNQSAPEDPRFS
ncbi:uncharacterized protein LOC133195893 [Saccostrea echinata]|uniref:uncharacterized protein LOC133195893 n=1 Tax=Saccostrea echinata TaxID=191078 RepID=UPI002A7EAED5|nr:uncharacterized protein LOC133195893 [Saccostrea echinata]